MNEAIVVALAEQGPASRLLASYAQGSDEALVEAEKLTLGMIEETAEWVKLAPKIDPRLAKGAEVVRGWWLHQAGKGCGEEAAEEFGTVWAEAFGKAKEAKASFKNPPIQPPVEEKPEEEPEVDEEEAFDEDMEAGAATGRALMPIAATRGEIILPIAARAAEQVALLNQKHAVIGNYGSKCAVLSWELWSVDQEVMIPTFQTFTDFRNRYMNRYVEKETEDGVKKVPAGKYWLGSTRRLSYEAVAFEPGGPDVLRGNRLNLYRGMAVEPRKGSWKRLREHIYRVLANGDPKSARYIIRWLAWAVQNPGKRAEAVLVFQGDEGAGKGTLAGVMLKIFGIYGLSISEGKHLVGSFGGHLQHCIFLFLDEAFCAGNVAAEGRLKNLVTEKTITIEPKYFQPFQVANVLHIIMASNNDWVVPAGHGSRRYAVYKVSNARVGDFAYFNELNAELDNGGREAMLWDLLRLELGSWHPKEIYETSALLEQKQHSLRGLDAWIEAMLQEGVLPKPFSKKYPNRCLSKDLLAAAKEHDHYTNESRIAKKLQGVFDVVDFNNKASRGWIFPALPECRRLWETRNGGRWPWQRQVEEWQEPRTGSEMLDEAPEG